MYTIEIAVVQSVKLLRMQSRQTGKAANCQYQTVPEYRLKQG